MANNYTHYSKETHLLIALQLVKVCQLSVLDFMYSLLEGGHSTVQLPSIVLKHLSAFLQ